MLAQIHVKGSFICQFVPSCHYKHMQDCCFNRVDCLYLFGQNSDLAFFEMTTLSVPILLLSAEAHNQSLPLPRCLSSLFVLEDV